MDSSSGFIQQVFWLNHWPVVTVPKIRALSSPQKYKKIKPLITPPRILLTTCTTERFSSTRFWLVSTPMKDRKFQISGGLVHELKQGSNMHNKMKVTRPLPLLSWLLLSHSCLILFLFPFQGLLKLLKFTLFHRSGDDFWNTIWQPYTRGIANTQDWILNTHWGE